MVRNRIGQIWNTSGAGAFETYSSGNYAQYVLSATEQAASAYYTATFPTAIVAGIYSVVAKERVGGSEVQGDPTAAAGSEQWNGSVLLPLSDVATSGQVGQFAPMRLARGIAVSGFPFYMRQASDHVTPFTSGVVSGQVSRDGGSFGALQSGTITENGLGCYRSNLTSGDVLATTLSLHFTGTGISGGNADPCPIAIILQRTSGQ